MRRLRSTLMAAALLFGAIPFIGAQEQTPPNPIAPSIPKPKTKSLGMPFDSYPYRERYKHHTGYVLIEYSINDHGRATDLRVLESTSSPFSKAAQELLREIRYAVPSDWSSIGGPAQRYQLQFHFAIPGYPDQEGRPGIEDVVITAYRS